MTMTQAQHPLWRRRARELGTEAAKTAASWFTAPDDPEEARELLALLEEGDPAAEAYLPRIPTLSGEYADGPTPRSVAVEATGLEEPRAELVDELAEAWEEGVLETFEATIEERLREAAEE